jgi:polyisoprenoid-binding protein YceI
MKTLTSQLALFAMAMIAIAQPLRAEKVERFEGHPDESEVRVDGTSTMHDWTVRSPTISGAITFKIEVKSDATTQQVRESIIAHPDAEAVVAIGVRSLKSDKKDKGMDAKMYEAMKADSYPKIEYKLTKFILAKGTKAEQEEFDVDTTGDLTIAGVTRHLQMPMRLIVVNKDNLQITGETNMKMTDFKVKPPQALLGAIKSGDKIRVSFTWNVRRAKDVEKAK